MAPGLVGPEKAARGKLPDRRVVDDDRAAGLGGADRLPDPEAGPAAGADRRGVEPARATSSSTRTRAAGTTGVAAARLGRRWLLVGPRTRSPSRSPAAASRRGGTDRRPRSGRDHPRLRQHARAGPGRGPARGRRARRPEGWPTRLGPFDEDEVNRVWAEERERQFREEVPQFREVDLAQRLARVLARLRGHAGAARRRALGRRRRRAAERRRGARLGRRRLLAARSSTRLPPAPAAGRCSRPRRRATGSRSCRTGRSRRPSTATSRRPAGRRTCAPIVVSQRVGTIKPHPAIFAAARDGARASPSRRRHPPRRRRLGGGRRRREAGRLAGGVPPATGPADSPLPGQRARRRRSRRTSSWTASATWRRRSTAG